ncbi:MAG: hypothetical protein ACR2H3_15045 [Acidimicrobiales bacterium]
MDDWLARYAAALAHGLPDDAASVDLGPAGDATVLELARLVELATDTETAALATFLAGVYAALKASSGNDARAAMDEAVRVAKRVVSGRSEPLA